MSKTAFISYRRAVGADSARSVYQDLTARGCDLYFDVETQGPGRFDENLARQIEARHNFVLILTPGTLDGVTDAGDWVRLEIEHAMECGCNIVPLLFDDFTFADPRIYLKDKLTELQLNAGVVVHNDYFTEAMTRVYYKFLKPVDELEPSPIIVRQQAEPTAAALPAYPERKIAALPQGFTSALPAAPGEVTQWFLPCSETAVQAAARWEKHGGTTVIDLVTQQFAYKPVLLMQASVAFSSSELHMSTVNAYAFHLDMPLMSGMIQWEQYQAPPVNLQQLNARPEAGAVFGDLSPDFSTLRQASQLREEIIDMLYKTTTVTVPYNKELGVYGRPDEPIESFWAAASAVARQQRDREIDILTAAIEGKMDILEEELEEAAETLSSQQAAPEKAKGGNDSSLFSGLLTLFNRPSNRRSVSTEKADDPESKLSSLQNQFEADLKSTNDRWAYKAAQVVEYRITPYRDDITLDLFGLGWVPYWYVQINGQPQWLSQYR
jgi:TIR domain